MQVLGAKMLPVKSGFVVVSTLLGCVFVLAVFHVWACTPTLAKFTGKINVVP